MTLEQLVAAVNSLSDDQIPFDEVKDFINDGISAINIDVGATFPYLDAETDEPVFPEDWQRMLLIPFAKGRVKEKDSSEFEWEEGYEQFFANIIEFRSKYEIPEEYKQKQTTNASVSIIDYEPYGWGGW